MSYLLHNISAMDHHGGLLTICLYHALLSLVNQLAPSQEKQVIGLDGKATTMPYGLHHMFMKHAVL